MLDFQPPHTNPRNHMGGNSIDVIGFKSISSSAIVKFYYEGSLIKVELAEAKSVAVFIPFQSVECRE